MQIRSDSPTIRNSIADGADATRVVLRVTDEFGADADLRERSDRFTVEGPVKLIGDNPFALVGGTGAVWVRAGESRAPRA